MSTARHRPTIPTLPGTDRSDQSDQTGAEQLGLFSPTDVPLQFRLDERTRRRGLAHIALIRRQLAERAARHQHEQSAA